MAAVYPKQYKSFTTHKNLVEDIDASHVNNLQDEVLALQQTLGVNPHQDTALKMMTNRWASVAARLDAIQRGKGIPVCYMTKTSHTLRPPKTPVSGVAERVTIPFARPPLVNDPEGIFNGSGSVTTNRTGWWIASAYCRGSILQEDPERWLGIAVGGKRAVCHTVTHNFNGYSHTTVFWQGPVAAGKKIEMIERNPYGGKTYTLDEINFAVSMLREL
ncbi:hypothetical protein [Streptomyces sp. NPDC002088]|uniref:hypothetical protein n=1 Tax=Streptomyces sp. NPDC002088 TaxID=3154665 RepID=UPI00331BCC37